MQLRGPLRIDSPQQFETKGGLDCRPTVQPAKFDVPFQGEFVRTEFVRQPVLRSSVLAHLVVAQ
jgi:hypothetical protein